jgi:Carbamoyl-phosphate synthase L chain, N-terminal domain./Carbamoyl-phosphate synthase L chain, ATP binding domain./Biotin carboxylase C-terminal domain.
MGKILIANRGEIARRIIRTCRRLGMETVAVYSEADRDLPFVREADARHHLGGSLPGESYLDGEKILAAARLHQVDAIHPGYGFLSENAGFARRVREEGIRFIGPDEETIALMGDKINARKVAERAGVPVLSASDEITSAEEVLLWAETIGYPVLLKAAGGGGGIGMALCRNPEDLKKALPRVQMRAGKNFLSKSIYLEKFVEDARHIEVQIFGCSGKAFHLYERDCSVQRRNQKVIEETPAPGLAEETGEKLYEAAVRLAEEVKYSGAGTVEFLVDQKGNFYFLEMNTRLQVEHPVTEAVCAIDLVEWQILEIFNQFPPLDQNGLRRSGHAIEFRVYAEDPQTFYPSPGTLRKLRWGKAGNVRIDCGYEEGNAVPPFYDPLIAKCIVSGRTREECLDRAYHFFRTTEIGGIRTNIPLFLRLLEKGPFKEGNYSTNLLTKESR